MGKEAEKDTPIQLEELVSQYNENHHTPELLTEVWTKLWNILGERVGIVPAVSKLRATQKELGELIEEGRIFVYLPNELSSPGKNKYLLLNRMFPDTRTNILENPVAMEDEHHNYGWIDIEASIETPYVMLAEEELKRLFTYQHRVGQRLATYVVGANFTKLTTGQYFDINGMFAAGHEYSGYTAPFGRSTTVPSWSRLLGTRISFTLARASGESENYKSPLRVMFNKDGHLSGGLDMHARRQLHVGGRSEGLKFSLSL